jgi:hypothetical protein
MQNKLFIRDDNYFRYFAPEKLPTFPSGLSMEINFRTTHEMMEEQRKKNEAERKLREKHQMLADLCLKFLDDNLIRYGEDIYHYNCRQDSTERSDIFIAKIANIIGWSTLGKDREDDVVGC